ncbi:MAG TPA: hypothetical protein VHI72_18060 [Hyphomicrobiaceae bacterium]|nr:hypothetical protein [Hyphomicrobiaceae bacterium]
MLDLLSRNKAGVKALLRISINGWSAEEWRVFYDERAAIAEFNGSLPRAQAEVQAFAHCVAEWLNYNPVRSSPGLCLACGDGGHGHDPLLPFGTERTGHAWLHRGCWPAWHDERKATAVAALGAMGIMAPDAILPDMQDISPEPVRQRDDDSGITTSLELPSAPAHRPEDLCLHVCDGVRIVSDDLQWIMQTKKGGANAKSSGWKPRGFCRSRVGLRRVLRERLGKTATEDDIAKLVDAFPEFHHIWLAGLRVNAESSEQS